MKNLIPDAPQAKTIRDRSVWLLLLLAMGGVWIYLLWIARDMTAAPFDTYEIYLNAKIFAGLDSFPYHWKRPPLLPWLLTPFFHFFSSQTALLVSRIMSVFFYGLLLLGTYKIFRRFTSSLKALSGTFLLALNPLLLHHAPFLKEDIPASALATLAFWFYLGCREQKNMIRYALTGLTIALAVSTRFNMLPWMLATLASYELFSIEPRPSWRKGFSSIRIRAFWLKTFFLILFPILFFLGALSLSWAVANHAAWIPSLHKSIEALWNHFSKLLDTGDSPAENIFFFLNAFTWPVLGLGTIGFFSGCLRKLPGTLWMSLWTLFFSLQQLTLTHFEARYLFPIFPPVCFFVITGASELSRGLRKILEKASLLRRLAGCFVPGALLLCFLPYAKASVIELLKFQDPVYRIPYMETVSRAAASLARGKNIYWVGRMYPLHPKEFVFHPKDEVGYIYHFYNHTVRFYTGDFVIIIATDNARIYEKDHRLFVREALWQIKDGDVLIINPNPLGYNTNTLPKKILPLFVQKCRVLEFNPLPAEGDRQTFVSKTGQGSLQAGTENGQQRVTGSGLPDGPYELYAREKTTDELLWLATPSVKNGVLPPVKAPDRPVSSYFLLTYSPPVSFPHPEN